MFKAWIWSDVVGWTAAFRLCLTVGVFIAAPRPTLYVSLTCWWAVVVWVWAQFLCLTFWTMGLSDWQVLSIAFPFPVADLCVLSQLEYVGRSVEDVGKVIECNWTLGFSLFGERLKGLLDVTEPSSAQWSQQTVATTAEAVVSFQ